MLVKRAYTHQKLYKVLAAFTGSNVFAFRSALILFYKITSHSFCTFVDCTSMTPKEALLDLSTVHFLSYFYKLVWKEMNIPRTIRLNPWYTTGWINDMSFMPHSERSIQSWDSLDNFSVFSFCLVSKFRRVAPGLFSAVLAHLLPGLITLK